MNAIAYYRVSTHKQGAAGFGIEAQKASVARYVAHEGAQLVAEYTEVESAHRDSLENRPALRNAIAHAKRAGAVLVIARLDRLARSVHVTAELMLAGVDFVACDNPHANRLTIQILAAVAENESRLISERTRAGIAAAKRQGHTFGTPANLSLAARLKGSQRAKESRKRQARQAYRDLEPLIQTLRGDGMSLGRIADRLNALGHTTRRGHPWAPMQVSRILERSKTLPEAIA